MVKGREHPKWGKVLLVLFLGVMISFLLPSANEGNYYQEDVKDSEEMGNIMAEELLSSLSPSAVIAVEKMGPNMKGVHHTSRGFDVTALRAKAYHLFEKASAKGIFTGGIGDGGNEIGFGKIFEEARQIIPTGAK